LKNKYTYYKILSLTAKEDWESYPDIVNEVRNLAKTILDVRVFPVNYKSINGVVVEDYRHGNRKYTTIEECMRKEELCRTTIIRHIKGRTQTKDGRTFKVF
jgi:hypothetical protein